jgi:hypothetical protein
MTLRYARHAPEAYFAEDAARLAASLSGARDKEAEAVRRAVIHVPIRPKCVRDGLRCGGFGARCCGVKLFSRK